MTNLIIDGMSEEEIQKTLENAPLFEKQHVTGTLAIMRIPQGFIYLFEEGQDKMISQFVPA